MSNQRPRGILVPTGEARRDGEARRECGRISAMAPLASLAALICVGIGVDFSGQTLAEQDLRDQVTHCARHGASTVVVGTSAGHQGSVDSAYHCLSSLGLTGTATIIDDRLSVESHSSIPTRFLSLIGIDRLPTTGTASVALSQGR